MLEDTYVKFFRIEYRGGFFENVRDPVTFSHINPRVFPKPIRHRLSYFPSPQANGGTDQDFLFSYDIIGVKH